LGASLLVIGSRRTGLDRVLLGSIAEKVIRHAHGPVLVARPRPQRGRVLVATDLSDPSLPAIAAGIRESKRLGAKLTFLHCIDMTAIGGEGGAVLGGIPYVPPVETFEEMHEAGEAQLARAIESFGGQGERRVEMGPPTSVIVRTAAELGVELLVIGTIGRTGLRRALLGSVAEGVVRAAGCSVLIVRKHSVDQQ
jgi:nucleotide-binding universal stress UspA family protein